MAETEEYSRSAGATEVQAETAQGAPATVPSGSQDTIMVIDDVPANLKLLQRQLWRQGYRVLVFPDGPTALLAAEREAPDLILLDINMPGMDGFDVCARLKADETLRLVPVLFVTARDRTNDKMRAFAAGAVDYITKPFQADEVAARVNTHLTIRRQARRLESALTSLQRVERERDTLVHMVAHDLRSPLTVAQATFELMRAEGKLEECRELADRGLAVTRRMARLINTMLDMSTLESGRLELTVTDIDIRDLLRAAVDDIGVTAVDRVVSFVEPESGLSVACDAELVSRVVQNLLANAVEHTDAHTGTITVHAAREYDEIRVEIVDDGPGVPEENRVRIFEKLAHGVRGLNSHGLGLAFCKMAVEAHGGSIGVRPAAGKGSVFWFTLSGRDRPCG